MTSRSRFAVPTVSKSNAHTKVDGVPTLSYQDEEQEGMTTTTADSTYNIVEEGTLNTIETQDEQPAPFTYPVYHPEGDGLRRVEPLITTAQAERDLAGDPEAAHAWERQLAQEDAFHSPVTFGARLLDRSPFARLVRRSLAKSHIQGIQRGILSGASYPHAAVLQRMIEGFADTARQDGQIPVIVLIQTRDPADADVLALVKPALDKSGVAYFATAEHFDPRQTSGFRPDGHYRPEVDQMFGRVFAALYAGITPGRR